MTKKYNMSIRMNYELISEFKKVMKENDEELNQPQMVRKWIKEYIKKNKKS